MKTILLDFRMIKTREQVHEYLAERLDFPYYYGKNLDSLYDMLTDINEDVCLEIVIPGKSEFSEFYEYLFQIEQVLQDAYQDNPCLSIQYRRSEE
ncbi:barstar family protein [Lachnospiraceae bacterium 62-35]